MSTSVSSYSFLFDSLSSDSSSSLSSLTSLLGDYSMIKSGTYKKLMNAYYSTTDSTDSSSSSSTSTVTSSSEKIQMLGIYSDATSLEDAADALNKSSLYRSTGTDDDGNFTYDRDSIESAVSDFVSAYNSYIESSGDSSSTDILSKTLSMIKTTASNSSLLSEIGITIGSDNKLELDEDTLSSASVSTISSLFKGSGSYGSTISELASSSGKLAYKAAYTSSSSGSSYTYMGTSSVTGNTSSLINELL